MPLLGAHEIGVTITFAARPTLRRQRYRYSDDEVFFSSSVMNETSKILLPTSIT